MITYPLNEVNYNAEDAELYLCTRTSGIFSLDDFPITVVPESTKVTIAEGIGWIRNSRFSGKVVAQKEPVTLTLDLADGIQDRIDVIAIQFNATENASNVVVIKGTPAAKPVIPDPARTESLYQLFLYAITRKAGEIILSEGNIEDLRLNRDYCGIMEDAVTPHEGLPLRGGRSTETVQQADCVSGGRAFRFSKVDASNKKFTLVHVDGSNVSLDEAKYDIGDEYSFIFVHKYDTAQGDSVTYSANVKADMIGKITSIQQETDGSVTVTVDTLHYTVKGNATIAENYRDDCLFIVPSKPEIGDVPIGEYATTLGTANINVARAGFVSGEGHINSGQYVLMGGKFNIGGYCGLIGGRENFVPANYGTAGGSNHIITGNRGTGFGGQQKVYSEYGFGGNRNNTVEAYAGTAFGDTNQVMAGATNGFIGGGTGNEITKPNGFIAGGTGNKMYSWRGFTAGEGNTNDTGNNNGSMGLNNVVQSHMGFAGGQKTRVTTAELAGEGTGSGYASFGWGNNLLITGGSCFGGGAWNKILADYGVVGGYTNQVKHKFCAVFGQNNYTAAENQLIAGKWAKPSADTLLAIGNGSNGSPSNAFEVLNNGIILSTSTTCDLIIRTETALPGIVYVDYVYKNNHQIASHTFTTPGNYNFKITVDKCSALMISTDVGYVSAQEGIELVTGSRWFSYIGILYEPHRPYAEHNDAEYSSSCWVFNSGEAYPYMSGKG